MKLVTVRIPHAYEPDEYVTGEQVAPKEPHSARICIRTDTGQKVWGIPVANFYTSDEDND